MKISEAIKWIDNRMCSGRGQWTEHHQPIIDEPWQAGRMAIEALQNSQWIPCSERLPENGHYYLWCSDIGCVQSDYYWDGFEHGMKYGYNIVAWMPLPKPYREESND